MKRNNYAAATLAIVVLLVSLPACSSKSPLEPAKKYWSTNMMTLETVEVVMSDVTGKCTRYSVSCDGQLARLVNLLNDEQLQGKKPAGWDDVDFAVQDARLYYRATVQDLRRAYRHDDPKDFDQTAQDIKTARDKTNLAVSLARGKYAAMGGVASEIMTPAELGDHLTALGRASTSN